MKHIEITDEELDRLLDSQFNPPSVTTDFSESDFYDEWKSVQGNIKATLLKLGFKARNDDGDDYTMADDWGYSRHHEVEIHSKKLFDKRLLPVIQELLKTLPEDYEIVILHDLFLRDEIKPIHVIVRRNEMLSQTEDPELLKRLGLDVEI